MNFQPQLPIQVPNPFAPISCHGSELLTVLADLKSRGLACHTLIIGKSPAAYSVHFRKTSPLIPPPMPPNAPFPLAVALF